MPKLKYPIIGTRITFRETHPKEIGRHYLIRVSVDGSEPYLMAFRDTRQKNVIKKLIREDKKILGATVRCMVDGRFVVIEHSPQTDFMEEINV